MNVETLSKFLTQLAKPVSLLDPASDVGNQLAAIASALAPFAGQELSDFAGILSHAEHHRASGEIPVEPPGVAGVRHSVAVLHKAIRTQNETTDLGGLQKDVAAALVKLGSSVGLKITKPKADPKWIDGVKTKAEADAVGERLTVLAGRIPEVAALEEEGISKEIDAILGTQANILKAAAITAGVSKTSRLKGRELVLAALAVLTKLPLDVKPKGGKAKVVGADDGTILQITSELTALATRIDTVEAVADVTINAKIDEISQLPEKPLKAAAVQAGVGSSVRKKGRELVLAALAVLTKLPLDVKPKGGKAKVVGADDGTILQITSELKNMAIRATNPDAVSDAEIEEMLTKVEASSFSDAQMKEIARAVTGVKETTRRKAFLALRGKLTAAKRGLEGQKI